MPKFKLNTLALIFGFVCVMAGLTWIVPAGEYSRAQVNGRTQVVANSFVRSPASPQGIGQVLKSPIVGFQKSSHIIIFLFVIGGVFSILHKTEALTTAIRKLAQNLSKKPKLQVFLIPICMLVFSIGGSVFGMAEEIMPFVLIFIPLARSLGYDSIVGTAIPFLGGAAGFAGSTLNPFIVGVAQNIAQVPMFSGLSYRLVIWVISTVCMITFVMIYAARVKANPKISPVYEIDQKRAAHDLHGDQDAPLTGRHVGILLVLAGGMVGLVVGILKFDWYITEIAALFLGIALISGLIGRLSADEMTNALKEGARDMIGVSLIIACSHALLVIAEQGKIIDTFLYHLADAISGFHPIIAAQAMFVSQGVINFFVHSGSGQAALTMPVMAPLADVLGITRQTAVLAFQFGEGWINPILPTSGVTMGILGLAEIPWGKWARWMLPAQIFFFILALVLLIPPVLMHWQ